ncbi:hypothetical protein AHAS_Ahas11G0048400 [Arachis hypogaea]
MNAFWVAQGLGDFHALRDALTTFSSSLLNYLLQTLSILNRDVTRKNAFDSLITCLCKLQHRWSSSRITIIRRATPLTDVMKEDGNQGDADATVPTPIVIIDQDSDLH